MPRRRRSKNPPRSPMLQRCSIIVGSQAIRRSLKPGIALEGESFRSPSSTQASSTGTVRPDVRASQGKNFQKFHLDAEFLWRDVEANGGRWEGRA